MTHRSILYTGFILATLLALLNLAALNFYFYWTLAWYDYMMHFLGGAVLGVMAVWLLNPQVRSGRSLLFVFVIVMLIGGAWEALEYMKDIAVVANENYTVDTTHDLVMDALGMLAAYFMILPTRQLS